MYWRRKLLFLVALAVLVSPAGVRRWLDRQSGSHRPSSMTQVVHSLVSRSCMRLHEWWRQYSRRRAWADSG